MCTGADNGVFFSALTKFFIAKLSYFSVVLKNVKVFSV